MPHDNRTKPRDVLLKSQHLDKTLLLVFCDFAPPAFLFSYYSYILQYNDVSFTCTCLFSGSHITSLYSSLPTIPPVCALNAAMLDKIYIKNNNNAKGYTIFERYWRTWQRQEHKQHAMNISQDEARAARIQKYKEERRKQLTAKTATLFSANVTERWIDELLL